MGLLFVASSRSVLTTGGSQTDKLLHVLAYLILGSLLLRAAHGGVTSLRPWPTAVAFALTVAYGVSDELHQIFVPGRVASVADGIADAVGAGLAIMLMGLLGSLRDRRVEADR
jgi:VanZ family protein